MDRHQMALVCLAAGLALAAWLAASAWLGRRRTRLAAEDEEYAETQTWISDLHEDQAIRRQLRSPGRFIPTEPLWKDEQPVSQPDTWLADRLAEIRTMRMEAVREMRDYRAHLLADSQR